MKSSKDIYIANKKAHHEYNVLDKIEAGVVLSGGEVKSIRLGKVDLSDAFARIINDQAVLKNVQILPYQGQVNYNPKQDRKLLLHRNQINTLIGKLSRGGVSLVPLALYSKNNFIKVELGLVSTKSKVDKRKVIKKRDEQRKIEQELS